MRGCPRGPELGAHGSTLLEKEVRNDSEVAMEERGGWGPGTRPASVRLGVSAILQKRQDPSCNARAGRCEPIAPVHRSQGLLQSVFKTCRLFICLQRREKGPGDTKKGEMGIPTLSLPTLKLLPSSLRPMISVLSPLPSDPGVQSQPLPSVPVDQPHLLSQAF